MQALRLLLLTFFLTLTRPDGSELYLLNTSIIAVHPAPASRADTSRTELLTSAGVRYWVRETPKQVISKTIRVTP